MKMEEMMKINLKYNMTSQIAKACLGLSKSKGGLNLPEIKAIAESNGLSVKGRRDEILARLCKHLGLPSIATPAPRSPRAIASPKAIAPRSLDFSKEIQIVRKQVRPEMVMGSGAVTLANKLLIRVLDNIIGAFRGDMEAAIGKVLVGSILSHAKVVGTQNIVRLNMGYPLKLVFSTTMIESSIKGGARLTKRDVVYLTAVLEYLAAEIIEVSASSAKGKEITVDGMMVAISADKDLNASLKH